VPQLIALKNLGQNIQLRLTLIGLGLGLLVWGVAATVYHFGGTGDIVWANWQSLGAPLERPTSIIGIGSADSIAVVVGSGPKLYMCCQAGPGNWQELTPDDKYMTEWFHRVAHQHLNVHSGVHILNMWPNVVDSAVERSCDPLCSLERDYVLQSDGSVWTWSQNAKNSAWGTGPVPIGIAGLTTSKYIPSSSGDFAGLHYIEWSYAAGLDIKFSQYCWLIGAMVGLIAGVVLARFGLPTRP
jgi:hypothetical protein